MRFSILNGFLVTVLCSMPLVAAMAPRFLALAPGLAALVGLILFRLSLRKWPVFSHSAALWLLGIIGLCLLSGFWAVGGFLSTLERSAGIALVLFSGFGLWSLVRDMPPQSEFRALFLKFFPLAYLLGLSICLVDLYFNGLVYFQFRAPETGDFNLSRLNRSVVALGFMSFIALWTLWKGAYTPAVKFSLGALIILALGAIFLKTDSQSSQMALAVGVVFFVFFPYGLKYAWPVLTGILALMMAITPWLAQLMFTFLASSSRSIEWLSYGYPAHRMEIWDFIARKALENPLYGFGLEATRDIPHFDTALLYTDLDHVLHPHNFSLQIWIEFGIIGVALAVGFLHFLLKGLQARPPIFQRLGLGLFMAVLSASAISYGLWQGWWLGLFCILAALYAALEKPTVVSNPRAAGR